MHLQSYLALNNKEQLHGSGGSWNSARNNDCITDAFGWRSRRITNDSIQIEKSYVNDEKKNEHAEYLFSI